MIVFLRRRKLGLGSCTAIAAEMRGIFPYEDIRVGRPDQLGSIPDGSVVIRWGTTTTIPANNITVINSAQSIHWCHDKRAGRLSMMDYGVPCPATWGHPQFIPAHWPEGRGMVVRPKNHSQGRHLYVCRTNDEIQQAWRRLGAPEHGCYFSELIDKVAEYRVFVLQGRVVWVARKTPGNPDDVAWNVARGGRFDNVRWGDWPLAVITAAIAAARLSGTHFCGVDVMVDGDGGPYVLEVNSAPSQTSPYRQECVAKAFAWMVRNTFDLDLGGTPMVEGWRDVIHPGLMEGR